LGPVSAFRSAQAGEAIEKPNLQRPMENVHPVVFNETKSRGMRVTQRMGVFRQPRQGLTNCFAGVILLRHTPYFGEICHEMLGIPADGGIGWPPIEEWE